VTATAGERSGFDRRLVLPMVLGSVLNPVNSSIIAVSLVPIGRAFDAPPSETAWLVSALYLATAVGQPLVGRLVDVLGPRLLYVTGTALVGVAGVLGLLAQDLWMLVVARVVLGLGTCAGYPSAMFLVRREADRTGQDSPAGILTLLSVANQTIAVVGPTLGGFLIGVAGWRSTFAVNVPLSLACLLLARRLPGRAEVATSADRRFDLLGVVLFATGLGSLMFFLLELRVSTLGLLAAALVLLGLFGWVELRAGSPFIDLAGLRGNRPLAATYARTFLTMTVSYAFLYGYTQWLQDGRGLSPGQAGLVLVPMFASAIGVSLLTGRRAAVRGKLYVGSAVQLGVALLLLTFTAGTPVWVLVAAALCLGVPQGLLNLANQNAAYFQSDPERVASSAGLLRTFGYLGAIASGAATGLLLGASAGSDGLHRLAWFVVGAAVLVLGLVVADRSLGRVVEEQGAAA
jgi:MFS family permease